jgi:hypothetical protein
MQGPVQAAMEQKRRALIVRRNSLAAVACVPAP